MRLVISIVLSLFLVGCFSQSIEKVGKDIVTNLNDKNYDKLWDKYIDEDTKNEMKNDLDEVMKDQEVGALMLAMMGVPKDKMETLTPKELFGYVMSLVDPAGDTESDTETFLIYKGVELIDENTAIILLGNDVSTSGFGELRLVKIDNKWYFNMAENDSETVEEVEAVETVEDVDVDETVEETEVK